jgi:hypothetical protein
MYKCIVADFIALGYSWVIPVVRLGSEQKSRLFFRSTSNTKFKEEYTKNGG